MSASFSRGFLLQSKIRSVLRRGKRASARITHVGRLRAKLLKKSRFLRRRLTGKLINGPRTLADNIRFFANPGPQFEQADQLDATYLRSRARTIAFYLPQFHAFEENDQWWGEGFTEWRNVARGAPRFKGHYQPRIPRDLGFYDLSDIDTIKAQCALAKHNGIDAFCFYYYWFNGKRLMEKPLDLLAKSDIDQDFCIMWANENWTRTWDGLENDVLIKQDYLDEHEDEFIADTGAYMADPRYVRVNGQPLFILYRPGLLPEPAATIERWRKKWTRLLGETPLIMMVQGFGEEDPRAFGLDGAVEFPPHKVCAGLKNINDRCQVLDSNFKGLVRDYADVVNKSLDEPVPDFPLIKTVSPHWDNDARREGCGMTMHGSTPALYEKWLNGAIEYAVEHPVEQESLVFINAWNEWAEGAYLEPDVHFGHAYLNATKRAVCGLPASAEFNRILLVGHDAHRHGAQMLLLNMAKIYKQQFGMQVTIALKEGGPLVTEYQKITQTVLLDKLGKNGLSKWLQRHQFSAAICNTTVTGDLVSVLRRSGVQVVSLIHEMPHLIKDYQLEAQVRLIANKANHVVFPAKTVFDGFTQFTESFQANAVIKPQGTYSSVVFNHDDRSDIRDSLGIKASDKVVLGVGYADLRKGFDLFMDTARRSVRHNDNVHFVWAGAVSADMKRWIQTDFSPQSDAAHSGRKQIHIVGFTDNMTGFYSAADVLFLPSREDPYPTVVLEAMNVGLPVVLFRGTTGFDSLMDTYGYLVELGDNQALDEAFARALNEPGSEAGDRRIAYVETHCRFDSYCFDLLKLLHPKLQQVSVTIPNYNYAQYIEQRLSSIFAQNYPVFEVVLLDDNSDDISIPIAKRYARRSGRTLSIVRNKENSGSVFSQWHQASAVSRGNLLWIAEADDSADINFLSKLVGAFTEQTSMAFCDSSQIGAHGEHLSRSYKHYFSKIHPNLFNKDFVVSGTEFCSSALSVRNVILNVSSVIWNRNQLYTCMHSLQDQLSEHALVGDWLIYLKLLNTPGTSLSYVSDALNTHRRHATSVTHTLDNGRHLQEIEAMHRLIEAEIQIDTDIQLLMREYINELSAQFDEELPELDRAA